MSETPAPPPRLSLAVTCLGHALVLSLLASTLPWRSGTLFALATALLAALHLCTAVVALLDKPPWLSWVWRALSVWSALVFVTFGWSLAAAALYVSKLYIRLGPIVVAVVLVAAVLLAGLTLPMAIWGARYTWPKRFKSLRSLTTGASALLGVCVFTLPLARSAAAATRVPMADEGTSSQLREVLDDFVKARGTSRTRSVAGAGPARCEGLGDRERLNLIVTYVDKDLGPFAACFDVTNRASLPRRLRAHLARHARADSTVVMDLIKAVKPLTSTVPLLDALELRPGLDGVCDAARCLPAWQLTLRETFSEARPLPGLPDASFGFSPRKVREMLGASGGSDRVDGLFRIETETVVADSNGVHRLIRTRATPPAVSQYGVAQAVAAAQAYIVAAQEADGSFRYALDPATGSEDRATLNLPRQAGTAYALCELGRGARVRGTVRRALEVFKKAEVDLGDLSALRDGPELGLGKSALPLLAMLRCRELTGSENDRLIGQLARLMLTMQRDNGSFYPTFDRKARAGKGDHEQLYAAGQALLALVLLEQQLTTLKGSKAEPLPEPAALKRALDRGMDFYGGAYWPTPQRDFFFLEEGWHCLAARQALSSHRSDAYEQLCIDYVDSRKRFVLRAEDTAEPNFVGGYGSSDLFPPRNTATAGLGEALNAAIAIKQKRGANVDADKALLRDLVGFLLRAQWSDSSCFACRAPERVVGGFSQQLDAPSIRIDYVQHAMSAIGHGGRLLF
jgi:hypothetical protein